MGATLRHGPIRGNPGISKQSSLRLDAHFYVGGRVERTSENAGGEGMQRDISDPHDVAKDADDTGGIAITAAPGHAGRRDRRSAHSQRSARAVSSRPHLAYLRI